MSDRKPRWRIVHGSSTFSVSFGGAGMPGPGSDDRLLVGDGDRETALQALARAYSEGHLTREEHDRRSDLALNARSRGELDLAFADLPHSLAPPPHAGGGRPTVLVVGVLLSVPLLLLGVILLGDERGLQQNAIGLLLLAGLGLGLYGLGKWALAPRHADGHHWRPRS